MFNIEEFKAAYCQLWRNEMEQTARALYASGNELKRLR